MATQSMRAPAKRLIHLTFVDGFMTYGGRDARLTSVGFTRLDAADVPEPAALGLLVVGLLGLAMRRKSIIHG